MPDGLVDGGGAAELNITRLMRSGEDHVRPSLYRGAVQEEVYGFNKLRADPVLMFVSAAREGHCVAGKFPWLVPRFDWRLVTAQKSRESVFKIELCCRRNVCWSDGRNT